MAKPIKETPVLHGKDAKKFVNDNKEVKKISAEERQRIQSNYEALKGIAKFAI